MRDFEAREREIKPLIKAIRTFRLLELDNTHRDMEDELEVEGKPIKFLPLWKWLLSQSH